MEYNAKQLQIIEVAERLFSQKGFAGTSVRDIAQEADVNVSMISYYFGSKEKLIEALFQLRMTESSSRLETLVMTSELSALQKFNVFIDSVIDRLMGNQCFHNIMLREQLSSERTPIITEYIRGLKMRNLELIKRMIHEGQEAGEFRKDINVSLMTTTLYGTVNYAIASKDFYKKLNELDHLSDEEFQQHLRGELSQHLKNLFKSTITNEHHIQS
ncbi:TetR/AcrR family transcriptional regulator [Dyadobacter endophyticus]|uniref:TetR family transcriptional regulator n=1 Tax=Dyadobacter endophyticus TaxID=1749036 RepID=A0ABQ1Z5M0_9BACT|nr:TetR family transcriptional regulator [Dyadobacter endophyticus]GGH50154.1 TetR family transcriptional regulator [Dyadobacter endophyticus]